MRRGALISVPSLPVEFVEGGNATLSPGKEYWITAPTRLTLSRSARAGDRLIVVNNTEAEVTIAGLNLGGVDSSRTAFSGQSAVRLAANGEARLARSRRGWRVRGCDPALTFSYNGVPLSLNDGNPGRAGDLFHWLGMEAAKGSGQPWTNPTNTMQLASVASGVFVGSVANLTDRVASGQDVATTNVAGSWLGWQFPKVFRCTGFVIQTRNVTTEFPRSFSLRINTGTTLTSAATPATWAVAGAWSNQTQLNAANQYSGLFAATNPTAGNQLAIRLDGTNSSGSNFLCFQEVFLFGEYFG